MSARFVLMAALFVCGGLQAQSDSAEQPRLLLAREIDDSCSIELWNIGESDTTVLVTTRECPPHLFVSAGGSAVLFVENGLIMEVSLDNVNLKPIPRPLPNLDFEAHRPVLSVQPGDDYLRRSAIGVMKVRALGYRADGRLSVHAALEMAADDSYNYFFALSDDAWEITDELWCHRLEENCNFDALESVSTNVWAWSERWQIWHDDIRTNEYFAGEQIRLVPNEFREVSDVRRSFRIDHKNIELKFSTTPRADTNGTHTFSIELIIDGAPAQQLSKGQCLATLVDRYLLVQQFGGSLELVNIVSGTSVFGGLVHATWID